MRKIIVIALILGLNVLIYTQWMPDVRLTNNPSNSFLSLGNRCIAANGEIIHTVWDDERDGNREIYYKHSTDGGINWEADYRLTNDAALSSAPSVAVFGQIVYAVWFDERDDDQEIYLKNSSDDGITWGADVRITNALGQSTSPKIVISGQVVHLIWSDSRDGKYNVFYKRSTDGGISWGTDIRISNGPRYSVNSSISEYGQNVHIVWQDDRDGNDEIYYKRSTNCGVSWGVETRLTNYLSASSFPCIDVIGQHLQVVWQDYRDANNEIYNKVSTDGGVTWGPDIRLTNNSANSYIAKIHIAGEIFHVVWYDDRDGNQEIYYKNSTNAGINWTADTRLTVNPAASGTPSIVASGQSLHIVWVDTRDGNFEIFYKLNPTGNLIPPVSPPLLISPVNNSLDQSLTPLLNWDTVDYALTFRIQVSSDSLFGNTAFDSIISDSQIIIPAGRLINNQKYFWKVCGSNVLGEGPWSAVWNFRTIIAPPLLAPVLVTPLNNSSGHSLTPQLNWDTVINTTLYQSQVSTDSLFTAIVVDTAITLSEINIPAGKLANNVKYFWKVRAVNSGGNGPWSIVWNFNTALVGISQNGNLPPKKYKLYENYPNPFNPSTKIRFDIPNTPSPSGEVVVVLNIYDILGREVAKLVNEQLQPGTYEVDFDGSSYPSGVYFYKIISADFSKVKKMILLK